MPPHCALNRKLIVVETLSTLHDKVTGILQRYERHSPVCILSRPLTCAANLLATTRVTISRSRGDEQPEEPRDYIVTREFSCLYTIPCYILTGMIDWLLGPSLKSCRIAISFLFCGIARLS